MNRIVLISLVISSVFAGKLIEVDLTNQTLVATNGGKIDLRSKISSGRYGHETPAGQYRVLGKEKMHISNLYPIKDKKANIRGGAHMPYMLRVTNTGVAIHAGEVVDYPDSHGCIRIPYGEAMQLYKWADIGTKIRITGKASYKDEINQMRISLSKKDRSSKERKQKKFTRKAPSSIRWIEDQLSYYDSL